MHVVGSLYVHNISTGTLTSIFGVVIIIFVSLYPAYDYKTNKPLDVLCPVLQLLPLPAGIPTELYFYMIFAVLYYML